jgi:hypothetical protein
VGYIGVLAGELVEHWNGTSWSQVSNPAFSGTIELFGISADSSNDVWAVGNSASGGGAVTLHFDGTSWTQLIAGPFRFAAFIGVTALSPTNVWAVGLGDQGSHTPIDLIDHWNGTSWSIVKNPTPNPHASSRLSGVAAVTANDIWAVGGGVTENWNGTNWSLIAIPSGVQSVAGVTALSDGTVVVVGEGTNNSAVILSNDPSGAASANVAGATLLAAPITAAAATPVAPTPKMPAPLHSAAVGQLFAVDDEADQALRSASRSSKADEAAEIGDPASSREASGLFLLL